MHMNPNGKSHPNKLGLQCPERSLNVAPILQFMKLEQRTTTTSTETGKTETEGFEAKVTLPTQEGGVLLVETETSFADSGIGVRVEEIAKVTKHFLDGKEVSVSFVKMDGKVHLYGLKYF